MLICLQKELLIFYEPKTIKGEKTQYLEDIMQFNLQNPTSVMFLNLVLNVNF